jgi:hypothetical protein
MRTLKCVVVTFVLIVTAATALAQVRWTQKEFFIGKLCLLIPQPDGKGLAVIEW